jgi:hypothetical protein
MQRAAAFERAGDTRIYRAAVSFNEGFLYRYAVSPADKPWAGCAFLRGRRTAEPTAT